MPSNLEMGLSAAFSLTLTTYWWLLRRTIDYVGLSAEKSHVLALGSSLLNPALSRECLGLQTGGFSLCHGSWACFIDFPVICEELWFVEEF